MTDLPGLAIKDFYEKKLKSKLYVHDQFGPKVEMPISMYFRDEVEMPELEDVALENCEGRILDVGAGAGSHALALQVKGLDVSALEISPAACEVMESRGVKDVICADFFKFNSEEKFDTILLLMNGIGLCGTIENLKTFLKKSEELLNEDGRLVFDSSDTIYMYEHDILPERYYGEVECAYSYKNLKTDFFKWLYIDQDKLREVAEELGWEMKVLFEDNHYQYLVELKK
ncbi:Methyltransferase domain-containing protein [Soonwooa buanensis]|uniref:Methyltransferase domain-containing protein n=1 Tax=Soonwooa buanensis TaxID=619805 RepID=A0A1T5FUF9_9FLAO|nr:class I SAM-dependent methyltransferase [Soonwooa buanensis]SKB99727.1 Methyltransferase domain-containing protein [Soonwooa buanensis]